MIRRLRSPAHAPRHLSATEVRAECGHIQEWLFAYLSTDVDPYDFGYLTDDWIKEEGNDIPGQVLPTGSYPEDMTPEQLKAFTKWLKNGKLEEVLHNNDTDTPAYLTLHAKTKLPAGAWFIHFTNARFDAFDRGSTIEGLHLSTWKTRKDLAQCSTNLSDTQGLYDVVFGFAFDVDNLPRARDVRYASKKYGRNAVVFQCDCAVEAYHDGDNEYQSIFPVCSEYNVHPISFDDNGIHIERDDGEVETFETLSEAIDYIEKPNSTTQAPHAPEPRRPLTREPARAITLHPKIASIAEYAASFLVSIEGGADEWPYVDEDDRAQALADPRVPILVDALARVGVTSIAEVLGQGSFGIAARTVEGHVVKLTADAAEVLVGATLVGKKLSHVVGIYGAWYVRGIKLNAEAGWDAEQEEVLRKPARVGILIEQLLSTDEASDWEKKHLSKAVFDFKKETHNEFSDFTGLSARQKREKLEAASVELGKLLRDSGGGDLALDVASALVELRSEGIYAIDVHGGNVGWDPQVEHYRIFDIGVGSPPPDGPKPKVVGPRGRDKTAIIGAVAPPVIVGEI